MAEQVEVLLHAVMLGNRRKLDEEFCEWMRLDRCHSQPALPKCPMMTEHGSLIPISEAMPGSAKSLKDTQNEPDHRRIDIDRVGVKGLRYPFRIRDKAHESQHTVAICALTVDLPHHFKGTHMSRFVEVLNEFGPEIHVDNIRQLLADLVVRLHSKNAHVEFEFPFFLEKRAPVTQAAGMMDYTVRFSATMENGTVDFVVTVVVAVTTLCPCSKAIAARGAHNQRGQVTLSVRFRHPIWIEDLIELVEESSSSELYSLLKRPDEKAVTERAYDNPVFVEDLVRNVAERADAHEEITWYQVEAENFESIHNHNAYARIERRKGG
jgi:GTP cyclohydrolase I